ncbi:MAX gene-associated protein isoform X1 [Poecilia latipinna]|uniref:MAX gene-associated protein isoform X1 n=1 Tax=Poecilia latipinna TaxID=48699 RepID=UPI00072E1C68|nr:PREDICTED: MAX gene-associated protein-like isoform X1 [Poecilia latipinna]XP_014899611.1 PREDICTED: MAX gene-associated protein-like isoform X1 [Poecilia latipinna]XP_014899612.1 PREDICTED: MAX gene-associated protein-like isoform X1 [Poecilia latipinna]XP_014899613.1 PREDICTED: MAX gene-associated protein-like isoform X1 [Poecilia latipinna]
MPASDSELAAMEVNHELEEEEGNLPDVPLADPPAPVPTSPPSCLTTEKPDFATDATMEGKAISVASNECSSTLSSPAEAKPAVTPPPILEQTFDQSPATSKILSATDPLKSPGASLLSISDPPPWVPTLPPSVFGCQDQEEDFPAVLTFKGVSVTLENNTIWKQFCQCGTEMILTKQGRRMFPYCRYRLAGLDPNRMYSLVLSIVPSSPFRYRWNTSRWEANGPTEHQSQGLIRAFPHHYSPCLGSDWMSCLVSFYKLKLTNCFQDQEGHMILHSMHRYIPRLHIIPVLDGATPTVDKPVVMGPESITFTFPQTEFMAVTTYQNFRITQLKINHNPFAKGFREDGNNSRLQRIHPPAESPETRTKLLKPAEPAEQQEEVMDLSAKSQDPSSSSANAQETRLVLKPIMSQPVGVGDAYVPCIRGKHALGEIVLLQNQSAVEPKKDDTAIVLLKANSGLRRPPKARPNKSSSSTGTPVRSIGFRKRRRRKIRSRWTMYYARTWRRAAAAAKPAHSPSLTLAMQPELDEIEGLLFVSFTSKEALEVHVKDKLSNASSSEAAVSTAEPMETGDLCGVSVEENPETQREKTARLESLLLDDLSALRHRQVIHPVLQEVGLKLSSLDPTKAVDLKYLGVCLPPPPSTLTRQTSTPTSSPADEELPFISRTGKTKDVTKIKGWRNKFARSQETSAANSEGLPKNMSAFCSNMLDEYLENEAQQISERAAAFSTNPEDAVAYQLPARGSSYVKTLDSALRHRNAASRVSGGTRRPCPLSRKALAQTSPTTSKAPGRASDPDAAAAAGAGYADDYSQRLPSSQSAANQRAATGFGQSQGPTHRAAGFTKIQLRLLQMEDAAFNQGLGRTHLTPERLSTALSVIMSKERGLPSELPFRDDSVGPKCGQDFCRLGCVCPSVKQLNTHPDHCRQPECMFTCSCLRPLMDTEQPTQNRCGSSAAKLWNRNIHDEDLEPLYTPKVASPPAPVKSSKTWTFCPAPPMREEDKDPVYKYLESKLTCARVRAYNSLPPPVVTLSTALFDQRDKPAQNVDKPVLNQENAADLTHQKPADVDTRPVAAKVKQQIQIQSMCLWKNDRKMVLEGLCDRMNQNRLHQRFYIGPYRVSPLTRVTLRKPSGTIITYRMKISKPEKVSDCEDESEEEEKCDGDAEEEVAKDRGNQCGETRAGRLRARRKQPGHQTSGLIQVNDKYYNRAMLSLGSIGSLHPANRLAAHVTGRLWTDKISQVKQSEDFSSTPESLHVKATKIFVPPVVDEKTTQQTKADLHKQSNGSTAQGSQTSQPVQSFGPIQQNIHSSSTSSPVSLTVSPSLKSPSFLAKSGTYSFRICPPSTHASGGQSSAGVALPGGFTLIQLLKPRADKAGGQAKPPDVTRRAPAEDKVSSLSHLAKEWVGFDTFNKVRTLLSSNVPEPDSSFERKMSSGGNDEEDDLKNQQGSFHTLSSEEMSSDFSDSDECQEVEEMVDIETVEGKQGEVISKMRKDASAISQQAMDSADECREGKDLNELILKYNTDSENQRPRTRKNHSALEKLRRCEQRVLFDRLQSLLKLESRSSRHQVLNLAVKEIENLGKTSRYFQAERTRLLQAQSVYLKKLSVLAGKPESLIESKLKEIFERQKQREKNMKWKPFFSQLLQSKAALLQATAPSSAPQPSSPPKPDPSPPGQAHLSEAAKRNLQKLMSLYHPSKKSEKAPEQSVNNIFKQDVPTKVSIIVPRQFVKAAPKTEAQQKEPGASDQPASKSEENQKASENPDQNSVPTSVANDPQLQDKMAVEGASTKPETSGAKRTTIVVPSGPLALPLIRSKTGRLILPSSLKPLGQGYYTVMFMDSKMKGEGDEAGSSANTEQSLADPSKSFEKASPDADQPSDSDPKSSGSVSPLADLTFLNKAIALPPLDLQVSEANQGKPVPILVRTSSGHICLKPVGQIRRPPPANPEQDSNHDKSRPSKSQVSRLTTDATETRLAQTKRSDAFINRLAELKQGDVTVEDMKVKRGRGRPPGKKTAQGRGAGVKRGRSQDSDDDSPVKFAIASLKRSSSPNSQGEGFTSRPQTRGSLGKDFPSEKKRSWIDVEKELEPDLDLV